jgi:hypothetical protein
MIKFPLEPATTATMATKDQNESAIDYMKERFKQDKPLEYYDFLSTLDHSSITLNDRKVIGQYYEKDSKEVHADIKTYIKGNTLLASLGSIPKDEYEFVELQFEKWQTTMTYQGEFTIKTPYEFLGKPVNPATLDGLSPSDKIIIINSDPKTLMLDDMLAKIIYQARKLDLKYTERELERGLQWWIKDKKNELSSLVMSKIAFESQVQSDLAEAEWDRFVSAITDVNQQETKTVLKHFIWQVKRKMFRKPVSYHMMPVFHGLQGAGKSIVIKRFCNPIIDFFASTTFREMTDNRSHDIWKNFVLFFDEMGHSATSNLEDIKRKITEDTFISRILRTNSDTLVVNRATMIGASNKDLSTLIFDDTGMRRFFQIACKAILDWDTTADIDYAKLWRSVNENQETPLLNDPDILLSIKQVQASKRQITMLEKWLRNRKHVIGVEEKINATTLFEEFVEFEIANNGSKKSESNSTKFGRTLPDTVGNVPGLTIIKDKSYGKVFYKIVYELPVEPVV